MEVVLDDALRRGSRGIPHVLHYRVNTNCEPKLVFDSLRLAGADLGGKLFALAVPETWRRQTGGGMASRTQMRRYSDHLLHIETDDTARLA